MQKFGAFLACPPDWAQGPPLLREERGLYTTACLPDNCACIVDSLKQTIDASNFPTIVRKFTQRPLRITPFWQIENLNQNLIFLWNFHDFV